MMHSQAALAKCAISVTSRLRFTPAATATAAKAPTRAPQVEPWAGHENYSPESHNSLATDASIAIVNPVGTAKGTTSTTVADTATKTEEKSATDDTMKKKCVEQSGLVT